MPRGPPRRAPGPPPPGPVAALPAAGTREPPSLPLTGGAPPGSGRHAPRRGPCGASRALGALPGPAGPRGILSGFVQTANPEANFSPNRVLLPAPGRFCGKATVLAPLPATLPGARERAEPEAREGPAALAGQPGPGRPGAAGRGVVLGEAPAGPRVAGPLHNKSGPRARWRRCRRLARSLRRGEGWLLGGYTRGIRARQGPGGGCPGSGWRGNAGTLLPPPPPATPVALVHLLIGLLFASWLGVFLKGNSGRL